MIISNSYMQVVIFFFHILFLSCNCWEYWRISFFIFDIMYFLFLSIELNFYSLEKPLSIFGLCCHLNASCEILKIIYWRLFRLLTSDNSFLYMPCKNSAIFILCDLRCKQEKSHLYSNINLIMQIIKVILPFNEIYSVSTFIRKAFQFSWL